jgi:hypothetical protein
MQIAKNRVPAGRLKKWWGNSFQCPSARHGGAIGPPRRQNRQFQPSWAKRDRRKSSPHEKKMKASANGEKAFPRAARSASRASGSRAVNGNPKKQGSYAKSWASCMALTHFTKAPWPVLSAIFDSTGGRDIVTGTATRIWSNCGRWQENTPRVTCRSTISPCWRMREGFSGSLARGNQPLKAAASAHFQVLQCSGFSS